jgi:phenylpyruvate tautomerase PptA (4-oxalocrotonate tautomerase family)
MPYLSIQTNQSLDENKTQDILQKMSKAVSKILSKPENYVMIAIQGGTPMSFAGSSEPSAYVQLKSLGLPEESTTNLSEEICSLVSAELNIDAARIYVEFVSPERHLWGWNKKTF